jgi:uncharacterized protein (DUF697 family)
VSRWSYLSSVLSTWRELDVSDIQHDSERAMAIAVSGTPHLRGLIYTLLNSDPYLGAAWSAGKGSRYGSGINPFVDLDDAMRASSQHATLAADMLLLIIDGRTPLTDAEIYALDVASRAALPTLIVVCYGDELPAPQHQFVLPVTSTIIGIVDPADLTSLPALADAFLARLPAELHLAAARAMPGLRAEVASDLIHNTSFSNASFALLSGTAGLIPLLNIGAVAADMLVLTKNQVLLMYRLALAHGAPADFRNFLVEVASVVGLGYAWREAARRLVGLLPLIGLLPKVAISYAGTYTIGVVAWRWFAIGEIVAPERARHLATEALARGKQVVQRLRGGGGPADAAPPALDARPPDQT